MFADIIVDLSVEALDRSFQYIVPHEMEDTIAVGMMAVIPFGRGNREGLKHSLCSWRSGSAGSMAVR